MFTLADETLTKIYNEYNSVSDFYRDDNSYYKLSGQQLRELIESAFWASLQREEGRFHNSVLSFCPKPEENSQEDTRPFIFSEPIPLEPKKLSKLFTALDSTKERIYVCLDSNNENLIIWGFGNPQLIIGHSELLAEQIVIKSFDAGQLIVRFGSPTSLASLLVDSKKTNVIDIEKNPFIKFSNQQNITNYKEKLSCYKKLCNLMREHQHGGTLLIVDNENSWKSSCDLGFDSESEYTLKHLLPVPNIKSNEVWKRQGSSPTNYIKKTTDLKQLLINGLSSIARLTALDGATIITRDLTVKRFGAKITVSSEIENVIITQPFKDSIPITEKLSDLGGTRHQSAARFISKNKNSLAIVASQDGKVSAMFWDKEENEVFVTKHIEYLFFLIPKFDLILNEDE